MDISIFYSFLITLSFLQCYFCSNLQSFSLKNNSPTLLPFSSDTLQVARNLYEIFKLYKEKQIEEFNLTSNDGPVTNEINQILKNEKEFYKIIQEIRRNIQVFPSMHQLAISMDEIWESVTKIENSYIEFLKNRLFYNSDEGYYSLENFANQIVNSREYRVHIQLLKIYTHIVSCRNFCNESLNLLDHIVQQAQDFKLLCNHKKSLHMKLFEFYQAIRQVELKGYALIRFAFDALNKYNGVNYTMAINLVDEDFQIKDNEIKLSFKEAMLRASRAVWTCAPDYNKTYNSINSHIMYLIPNFVEFEAYESSCEYSIVTPNNYNFIANSWRAPMYNFNCTGTLMNCKQNNEVVCVIKSKDGYQYLRPNECRNNDQVIAKFHPHDSKHCMCKCEPSKRRFRVYLSPTFSDYNNSRVVTGARFRIRNRFKENDDELFIEIQEGELLPNGTINKSTLTWKDRTHKGERLKRGYQNSIIFSDEQRFYLFAQDLSDFDYNADYPMIITGLQFQQENNGVSLKIHSSKVSLQNYTTVLLSEPFEPNYYVSPISLENLESDKHFDRFVVDNENPNDKLKAFESVDHRFIEPLLPTRLNLEDLDRSDYSQGLDKIDSNYTQYLTLQSTNLNLDLGQHTVPFVDLEDVVNDPPVPLVGAALYHKGVPRYGGYLSLELRTLNYEKYIN